MSEYPVCCYYSCLVKHVHIFLSLNLHLALPHLFILKMAPSPLPLTKPSSFTQTTLNGSFTRRTSQTTISISDNTHRISKKPPPAKSKSKSAGPTASDRMLTDVLLSIKPVHLANLVSRQKNHEYRKYRLRDGVTRLWFYETGDGGGGRASITCVTSYLSTSLSIPLSALAVFLRFSASLSFC
jgi:hypothetical protein